MVVGEVMEYESNNAYHNDFAVVSASMLKSLDESPSLYEATYLTRTYRRKDSADLKLGRCLHAYVLQRGQFADLCPVMPDYHLHGNVDAKGKPSTSKSTTYYQERKAEFEQANRDRDIITIDELATIKALASAIYAHDDARAILDAGDENEVIHRWHNRVDRRCMMDIARPELNPGIIADIKTIQGRPTPRNFATAAAKFRWLIQPPMYLQAARDRWGDGPWRFLFIVVGKDEPHEVAIHELDGQTRGKDGFTDAEWAENRVEELVTELQQRRESGNWQANYQRGINRTPLPGYVRSHYYDVGDSEDE